MLNVREYSVDLLDPSAMAQISGGGDAGGTSTIGLLESDVKWGLYKVLDSIPIVDSWLGH